MPSAKLPPGTAARARPSGHRAALTLIAAALLLARPAAAQVAPADSAWLVRTTQALLDAVTSGDSAVWAPLLAPDWTLSDEEGRVLGRKEFLAGLRPLPAGQSGSLRVARQHLAGRPGVMVMSYDADEVHDYHGQRLHTRFRVTDTWVRRGRGWQQLASQATALPWPVAGRRVPEGLAREYVGTYALTPDLRLEVTAGDSGLALGRPGRPADPLHALDERIFVRHGVRGFWVFERDSAGKVVELVNWRDNNPVIWRRMP